MSRLFHTLKELSPTATAAVHVITREMAPPAGARAAVQASAGPHKRPKKRKLKHARWPLNIWHSHVHEPSPHWTEIEAVLTQFTTFRYARACVLMRLMITGLPNCLRFNRIHPSRKSHTPTLEGFLELETHAHARTHSHSL